ncbi:MAG: STAS domain-containing protein [Planctomycetes bacterium]|nr:STAS domain-containing protein [Planctomycetota bacterium]
MADEIQVVDDEGIVVVTVLETECAAIWSAVQPKFDEGSKSCVLDFADVSYLNSMSIASIISLRNKVLTAGGKVALANLQDNIKSVFRILKLEKLFELDMDGAAARAAVV